MLPGGRGLSASKPMHWMIRCRSFLRGMDSISLTAEGFKTTLYFSTPFEILHNSFVRQVGLTHTLVKCRQILGILRQAQLHGFIDQVGDRPIRLGCLQAKGPMDFLFEINSRSFWGRIHSQKVAL